MPLRSTTVAHMFRLNPPFSGPPVGRMLARSAAFNCVCDGSAPQLLSAGAGVAASTALQPRVAATTKHALIVFIDCSLFKRCLTANSAETPCRKEAFQRPSPWRLCDERGAVG